MKIALAQFDVIPGMPEKNIETMLSMIEDAKKNHVDLIAFPEMAIGGYLLGDKFLDENFCRDLMSYNEIIARASDGIAVAYGNIYLDEDINQRVKDDSFHPNKDGRIRKYNAVYVVQNGKPAKRINPTRILPDGVQPKTLLPNYRIFDDERYFFSTKDIARDHDVSLEDLLQPFIIEVGNKKIPVGFEICEDLWCEDYRANSRALNPTKILIENGAKRIVNISASPWTFGKNSARDRRVQFLKQDSGKDFVPFFYVNCTGAQNNGKNIVTFDGGSTAYNSSGLPVKFSKEAYKQESLIIDEEDLSEDGKERVEEPKIAQKYSAIIRGIRYLKDMAGLPDYPKFVIGMSGGIDSSLVAALLERAVGRNKVLGVNMPTIYNSAKTREAAAHVAHKLGIGYEIVPIGDLVDTASNILDNIDADGSGKKLSQANLENVQAKIRGTDMLSNIAAKYGALFTSNGNKLEILLGYATLYGDWGGALAPIGDLTKTEVVDLARYLNKEIYGDEVIPETLLPDKLWRFTDKQIQPSAELKEKQIDPMKFGYHCALTEAITDYKKKTPEDIAQWYLEGELENKLELPKGMIERWNLDNPQEFIKDLEWFWKGMTNNVFKRVQSPPIIITSKSSFGYDIRESILPYIETRAYKRIKQKVLNLKSYRPKEKS